MYGKSVSRLVQTKRQTQVDVACKTNNPIKHVSWFDVRHPVSYPPGHSLNPVAAVQHTVTIHLQRYACDRYLSPSLMSLIGSEAQVAW